MHSSWPVDHHVHTRWSLDIPEGPTFEDYIPLVEQEHIHVNFLDHLEIALFNDNVPLKESTIANYLEAFDVAKSRCNHISKGFEVDYYPDKETAIAEFLDNYKKDVDFVVGSVHEIAPFQAVTVPMHLQNLLQRNSFDELVQRYFEYERKMVKSGLFNAIAHPDVIFRFCGDMVENLPSYEMHPLLSDLANLCKERNVSVELNVRGLLYPCKRSFPSIKMARQFRDRGVKMFVGSDSHSVQDLIRQLKWIKEANLFVQGKITRKNWDFD
ncbi:MAG: histidinol phosphate phosphatase HisJ family [Promethearchaeota archaeon CR_4]|nr:MAG: histidinol phosphate phosphatase HisJ family [Candidatus Lokiarchaeota archaeon CR_4]